MKSRSLVARLFIIHRSFERKDGSFCAWKLVAVYSQKIQKMYHGARKKIKVNLDDFLLCCIESVYVGGWAGVKLLTFFGSFGLLYFF